MNAECVRANAHAFEAYKMSIQVQAWDGHEWVNESSFSDPKVRYRITLPKDSKGKDLTVGSSYEAYGKIIRISDVIINFDSGAYLDYIACHKVPLEKNLDWQNQEPWDKNDWFLIEADEDNEELKYTIPSDHSRYCLGYAVSDPRFVGFAFTDSPNNIYPHSVFQHSVGSPKRAKYVVMEKDND